MFAAVEEVARLLSRAGVGPWVTDEYGRNLSLGDWAAQFVEEIARQAEDEMYDESQRAQDIRELIAEKPRKMIAVKSLTEILEG